MKKLLACILAAGVSWAVAAPQTATLSVPGMYCASCPLTVKMALSRVEGVRRIQVSYERREAVVAFDDARTSIQALTKASAEAGYPATIKH